MSMIEAVARALCRDDGLDPDNIITGDRLAWVMYTRLAKAAIEAMREPTEKMLHAIGNESRSPNEWDCKEIWLAGINTALKEQS